MRIINDASLITNMTCACIRTSSTIVITEAGNDSDLFTVHDTILSTRAFDLVRQRLRQLVAIKHLSVSLTCIVLA